METEHIIIKTPGRPRLPVSSDPKVEERRAKARARAREFHIEYKEKLDYIVNIYMGGRCEVTGSEADLDIHHIEPSTKEFNVGRPTARSLDTLKAEADKCVLLCKPIHVMVHTEVHRLMKELKRTTELTKEGEASVIDFYTARETRRVIRLGQILRAFGLTRYGIIAIIRSYYEA